MPFIGTIAAFIAYCVKGVTGFANALIFNSILSFYTDSRNISPLDLLLGFPANIYMAWRGRREIRIKVVLPLILTLYAGMIPGAFFLRSGDTAAIKRLLGLAIIGLGVEMLLRMRKKGPPKTSHPALLLSIGIVSGFLCGLFGIGAFLVAYIDRTTKSGEEMRANLSFVFFAENLARLPLYFALGLLSMEVLVSALQLVPGMVAGLLLGIWLSRRLPEKPVRLGVIILLIAMGLSVFLSNL